MPSRRLLTFSRLHEVAQDVLDLLPHHRTLGRWSLAQICNHLAMPMQWSITAFPGPQVPRLVRYSVGSLARRAMMTFNFIPKGMPAPKALNPRADLDMQQELQNLRHAIEAFTAHRGPFAIHPLLGRMSPSQWERFHCIHCAHHLSFVLPEKPQT